MAYFNVLSNDEIGIVAGAADNFLQDFARFIQWFQHKKQKLFRDYTIQRGGAVAGLVGAGL